MSVNTYAKIKKIKKVGILKYELTICNADTNKTIMKTVVPTLKEALFHFDIENKAGNIEYGLQEVKI